ncbi:hypothetical protein HNY73_019537 [Argiope bruennichi]|uniref:Uncharacterized protein n=1 Tax=Argiope bruennichi TaxID=94029 RepID=A0A8T0E3L5_ARGBR|nr:hypothetical protein HNY73_019537 [Argiope bruennichi]
MQLNPTWYQDYAYVPTGLCNGTTGTYNQDNTMYSTGNMHMVSKRDIYQDIHIVLSREYAYGIQKGHIQLPGCMHMYPTGTYAYGIQQGHIQSRTYAYCTQQGHMHMVSNRDIYSTRTYAYCTQQGHMQQLLILILDVSQGGTQRLIISNDV